jgi:hypothetical protein
VALASVGLLVVALCVAVMLGDGAPANGASTRGAGIGPSTAPMAGWLSPLMADFADACGTPLDTASLASLSQAQAQKQVATLVSACSAASGKGSAGKSAGKHERGHGHGHRG